jgi:hypothetical protein
MPRFFFHIDHGVLVSDEDGMELPSIEEARRQAVRTSGQVVQEFDCRFWERGAWTMHVTSEDHKLLFSLRVASTVPSGEVVFRPCGCA